MVSINSAIEVDLTGQVCADSIGPRLYSGVGGQIDFVYGAARSKGGKPIIALPSTATLQDGTRLSRIVPTLKPGAGVTTTRNHVHYVVTEFGGQPVRQDHPAAGARAHRGRPPGLPGGAGAVRGGVEVSVASKTEGETIRSAS